MSTRSHWIAIALSTAVIPVVLAAADTPALNVRLGLWETTSTTNVGGHMPAVDTSKLTPEQKARMDAMMKQMMGSHTNTTRSCLTRERLERGTLTDEQNQPGCKTTITKNTSTTLEANEVCTGENARTIQLHFDAPSPTNVTGTFKSSGGARGQMMTVDGTITGHWVSADCGDTK